jgi:transposase
MPHRAQLATGCLATTPESGWMTSDVMSHYFKLLRNELFPDGHIMVLLDTYAAHRANLVRETAEQCRIKLVFIYLAAPIVCSHWTSAFSVF